MFNTKPFVKIFYQVIKFSIVGVFGVFINYCIFLLALVIFEIHYLISGLLGYLFAAVPIFFLNRYWTFKSKVSIFKGFSIYIIINLITLSSHSLIQYISKEYFGVLEIYSQACGIFVSVIISFILVRILMKSKI
jgi:putative flippase GtrA|tara:strand:+ start:379 stop:780 length:402 start_codon:yes stop_codon:yes gene_type:complete